MQIPVFLSKTLVDKLYIIQYPAYVREGGDNASILRTSVKPENQKICMEFAVDTTNKYSYDQNIGKQLALNTERKSTGNDDERIFNRCLQTFE